MLASLSQSLDNNIIVGFNTSDDAGVYKLNEKQALVSTADFITPPIDDPYTFGQIAASNSLSDIYAMGGNPISCLNLAGFPSKKLDHKILNRILEGANQKIVEAGAVLLGGHTTENVEPFFGLAVTGLGNPKKVWKNNGAKIGDQLILTKSIGSGVLFNANLKNLVSSKALRKCIDSITFLNKNAAEVFLNYEIHATTDVTGFGLAGHAIEMISDSKLSFNFNLKAIPIMDEALEMYQRGVTTGINQNNRNLVEKNWHFAEKTNPIQQELMLDPQTSGGLLVAVPTAKVQNILKDLHDNGVYEASHIGYVSDFNGSKLYFK